MNAGILLKILGYIKELRKYFRVKLDLGQDDDPNTPEEKGLLITIKLYEKIGD